MVQSITLSKQFYDELAIFNLLVSVGTLLKDVDDFLCASLLILSRHACISKIFYFLLANVPHGLYKLDLVNGPVGQSIKDFERFCILIFLLWLLDVSGHEETKFLETDLCVTVFVGALDHVGQLFIGVVKAHGLEHVPQLVLRDTL